MARRPDIQPHDESGRVGRIEIPKGYVLGENQTVEDVLAVEAELLRSEGIDPAWPGFDEERGARSKTP